MNDRSTTDNGIDMVSLLETVLMNKVEQQIMDDYGVSLNPYTVLSVEDFTRDCSRIYEIEDKVLTDGIELTPALIDEYINLHGSQIYTIMVLSEIGISETDVSICMADALFMNLYGEELTDDSYMDRKTEFNSAMESRKPIKMKIVKMIRAIIGEDAFKKSPLFLIKGQ